MAALTSLEPDRVTSIPHCSRKECDKTDCLVCRTYNAVARAARAGNAVAILLQALRRTAITRDQDTRNLIEAALSAHSQLTRDSGAAMSSVTMARRPFWLAQMNLPENIKRELTNMPVEPGGVFHPDSQNDKDKQDKQSVRMQECVQRMFSCPGRTRQRPIGQQLFNQAA